MRVQLDSPFDVFVSDAPSGLVGTITVEVYNPVDGSPVVASSAAGVNEPRPGTYHKQLTVTNTSPGRYLVRWSYPDTDNPGNFFSTEEELDVGLLAPAPEGDGVPTLDDVSDIAYARTKTKGGAYAGTFNEDTVPTAERVTRLINKAFDEVVGRTGPIEDPELKDDARNAMSIYTAMLIELSAEQMNLEKYRELKKLYDGAMASLIESLGATGLSASEEVATTGTGESPNWGFDGPRIGDAAW